MPIRNPTRNRRHDATLRVTVPTPVRGAALAFGAVALGISGSSAPAAAGGPLTIAWEAEPRSVDPRYAVDANSQYLENLVHCSLVDFDQDGRAVPDLAKSWTWKSPTALEVTLNSAARFDDGAPVTAADVQATYMYFKNDKVATPSPRKGAFAKMKDVVVAAPDKVIFNLEEPDTTFTLNLVVGVLPAKLAARDMLTDKDTINGCGPFKFKAIAITGIDLEPNANYALGPKPQTTGVVIKIVKDENTRFSKLTMGEVDIAQNNINRDKIAEIAKGNPALAIFKRPGLNTTYLGFNMRDKLAGDAKVRRAISMAVDREKIIKYVLGGMAVPATTLLTPADPFRSKTLPAVTFDPAAAKKLLDEAGFKDPDGDGKQTRFTISYKTTTDLTRVAVAKAIAADLRKVGIDVTVESLEWGRFKSDVEAGKVQMWSLAWVGFKDPDIYRFAFATESFPPNGGNRGWYSNPELDRLLNLGRTETDTAKRTKTYEDAQQIIARELPYVFLWHEEIFAVVSRKVEGFELYADGRYGSLTTAHKK